MSQSEETVTQTVTQDVARYARRAVDSRRRKPRHRAGPYLLRRGRVFYFRKRLPTWVSNKHPNLFLCLSLRTDLPLEAVKRAARLLTALEQKEQDLMEKNTETLTAADTKALLTEVLRAELGRILAAQNQAGATSDAELDHRIAELEEENRMLRRAARSENWNSVQELLEKASQLIAISLPQPISSDLGRQASSLKRRINDVELDVIEGDDVRHASRSLISEQGISDFDAFVKAPVLVSRAFAQVRVNYPKPSMQGNINALENLMLEFFGDIPVTAITKERQKEFFAWQARLPRVQGRAHGKNRFNKVGKIRSKSEEISDADAHDMMVTEELRERDDISVAEKRALLGERLVPRRTFATIKRDRDGLNRLFKSAVDLGVEPPAVLSYKEIERHIAAQAPTDELYVRVTKPKLRKPWTEERLAKLLTSSIYTGCQSKHRRWKRGPLIIRDATYWVPLIVLTIGSRIAEILLLKRSDILYRNGHYCFAISSGPAEPGKTEDSRRVIPIPQLLLDLGFVEWFHALPEDHGVLLFPEAVKRSSNGDVTSAFGKHLRRIFDHLDLGDFDEDFYAMRKTFHSILRSEEVNDGQRKAIAGHRHGDVLNIHYTAHQTKDLKAAVDKVNLKIEIGRRRQYGFPVIKSCALAKSSALDVEVTLNDHSEAASIIIRDKQLVDPLFKYDQRLQKKAEDRKHAARQLRDIIAQRPLNFPKNTLKRAAFEHLMALA
ncbi:DUF6538 domain-containing protein [Ruegeria intermedia]|nr:DUF6538 domain-containing protein [Ruegeria intermedia]